MTHAQVNNLPLNRCIHYWSLHPLQVTASITALLHPLQVTASVTGRYIHYWSAASVTGHCIRYRSLHPLLVCCIRYRSLYQKNGEHLPDAALSFRYCCATGPLPPRVRGSPFAFGVSSRVLVRLIESGAPFFLKCGAPKAFGAYNRLLRSSNHFPVPGYLPPSLVFAAFCHYEGEVVSNNIVAKACNKLITCLLNIFSRSRLLTTLPGFCSFLPL